MRTLLSSSWSNTDLTGNSTLVQVDSSTIYLVSNLDISTNSFSVLKSIDNGDSFTPVATYTFPITNLAFDPAIYYDPAGTIHIVGSQYVSSGVEVIYIKFDIGSSTLSTPLVVGTSEFAAAYDLVAVSSSNVSIATSLTRSGVIGEGTNVQTLVEIIVNPTTSTFTTVPLLINSYFLGGNLTFGGLSLVINQSGYLELFFVAHPALIDDVSNPHYIYHMIKDGGSWVGGWGSAGPIQLFTYHSMYTDDKFTVIKGQGAELMMSHCFYSDKHLTPVSTLAYSADGVNWSPLLIALQGPYYEPTISVDASGQFTLAYLVKNSSSAVGRFQVKNINKTDPNLTLSPIASDWTQLVQLYYSGLRGSKTPIDSSHNGWLLVGTQPASLTEEISIALSGRHAAPIAEIDPLSIDLVRGIPTTFTSTAYSSDGLPLTYQWSIPPAELTSPHVHFSNGIGVTTTLLVDKEFGPASADFHLTLTVNDGVAPPVDTTVVPHLPVNIPPSILWSTTEVTGPNFGNQNPIQAHQVTRGTTIVCTPSVTDPENDTLTYTWAQKIGAVPWTSNKGALSISLIGTSVFGDVLTFNLTISDGINPPVSTVSPTLRLANDLTVGNSYRIMAIGTTNFSDPAVGGPTVDNIVGTDFIATGTGFGDGVVMDMDGFGTNFDLVISVPPRVGQSVEDLLVTRSIWGGAQGLALRNNPFTWSDPTASAISSDYTNMRSSQTKQGNNRQVLISPTSVTILGDGENDIPLAVYYRKRFLPDETQTIVDAWQDEEDHTLILANTGVFYRYDIPGAYNCSDSPQYSIDLKQYLNAAVIPTITGFIVSQAAAGKRVIGFSTSYGFFLIEVNEADFSLSHFMLMSQENYMLLGANKVIFARFDGVENIRVGKLLIGTTDDQQPSPRNFQTYFDLSPRRVIRSWDQAAQINQTSTTGEIL